MGQKVHPNGFRYGITKELVVNWHTSNKEEYTKFLIQDSKIRTFIDKFTRVYMIGQVDIMRYDHDKDAVHINIYSARPGSILGNNGDNLKDFRKRLKRAIKVSKLNIFINVITIENYNLYARLVAEEIAIKLENRGSFRVAQKNAIRNTLKAGAIGIKTSVSGRLNGADMARREGYTKGVMRLHTLRQDINFGQAIARTTYGAIGVKVWISCGEILKKSENNMVKEGDK